MGEAHDLMRPVWLYHVCIVPNMQIIVGGYYLGDGKTCLRAELARPSCFGRRPCTNLFQDLCTS